MKTIKQRQLDLLNDTCNHFNSNNRSINDFKLCIYSGVGCAIGRLIKDKELCARLDEGLNIGELTGISRPDIFCQIPAELQELGVEFLQYIQNLHDTGYNWNEDGLSESGEDNKKIIIDIFELNK